MRTIVPVFAAMLFAAPEASALGQGQSNCLDYLTADAAFEKVAAPYRQAKSLADSAYRKAIRQAAASRREALNKARQTLRNGNYIRKCQISVEIAIGNCYIRVPKQR